MSSNEVQKTEVAAEVAIFDTMLADITLTVRPILAIKVSDSASEANARKAGGQIASLSKQVDARVKELCEPLKQQIDQIRNAGGRVKSVLAEPEIHVRTQLNSYTIEVNRKREEELQIQRAKEAAERKAADDKRRAEQEALRLQQEEERRKQEAAAQLERDRIEVERQLAIKAALKEAAGRKAAASLFGEDPKEAAAKAKAKAAEEKRLADEKAAADRKALEQRAADEKRLLEENQERTRIAEQARLQRESDELQAQADAERKGIEAQRVKGSRTEIVVHVLDAWAVPREFLKAPEVMINDAKKAYKQGRKEIPGLHIYEEVNVALRAEPVDLKERLS